MKITSITWGSDIALLAEACAELGIALIAWTPHDLEDEWNAGSLWTGQYRDRVECSDA